MNDETKKNLERIKGNALMKEDYNLYLLCVIAEELGRRRPRKPKKFRKIKDVTAVEEV